MLEYMEDAGSCVHSICTGGRIFEKGGPSLLSSQKGGGGQEGFNFGPNVKKPASLTKRGGVRTPPPPLDPPMM